MKKIFILPLFTILLFNYGHSSKIDRSQFSETMSHETTPPDLLLKIADSFFYNEDNDSAMAYYASVYNRRADKEDIKLKELICKALNRASTIYFYHYDYKASLQLLLKALDICEEINYKTYIGGIYNNIGNVYFQFKDFKSAKKYYNLAYTCDNATHISAIILNNLGLLAYGEEKFNSALFSYKKACEIIKKNGSYPIYNQALNNIGSTYTSLHIYDSALLYYRMALNNASQFKEKEKEANILSNIGRLYFAMKQYDSANYYLKAGTAIAEKYQTFNVLADNYLSFSEIEEAKGHLGASFNYYKKYATIKDSLFNASKYARINELLFLYSMTKVDKQIQELNLEQEIKERTIAMQRTFQILMGLALLIVGCFLFILYRKNTSLQEAYNSLVLKNIEIVKSDKLNYLHQLEYEERLKKKDLLIAEMNENLKDVKAVHQCVISDKTQNSGISDDTRRRLELKILEIMNDRETFCDIEFSLVKLSEMVGSNLTYISWIINNSFDTNFSTFINEYRIKEACRMFANPEYTKYSIETISAMVGFKHKSSFNPIFKEITGLTPSVYIRSLKTKV